MLLMNATAVWTGGGLSKYQPISYAGKKKYGKKKEKKRVLEKN
jgi:hypothetical protein